MGYRFFIRFSSCKFYSIYDSFVVREREGDTVQASVHDIQWLDYAGGRSRSVCGLFGVQRFQCYKERSLSLIWLRPRRRSDVSTPFYRPFQATLTT